MKPDFALSLSFDGIGLLMRSFPGWLRVGETVALDVPDLALSLRALHASAAQMAPDQAAGVTCKLIIPNDQIRYLTIETGDISAQERADLARAALDGQTPYPVEELAYDWAAQGESTHIAAVARETLHEAESFAQMHGFTPLSFVAIPLHGTFQGEPFFGTASGAAALLQDGEAILRDTSPIRIIGQAPLPETDAAPDTPHPEVEAAAEAEVEASAETPIDDEAEVNPAPAPLTTKADIDAAAAPRPSRESAAPPDETPEDDQAPREPARDAVPAAETAADASSAPVASGDIPEGAARSAPTEAPPQFSTVRHSPTDQPPRDTISAAPRLSGVSRPEAGPASGSIPIPTSQSDTPRPTRAPLHLDLPQAKTEGPAPTDAESAPSADGARDPDPASGDADAPRAIAFATRRSAEPRALAVTPSPAAATGAQSQITAPRRLTVGLGGEALAPNDAPPVARGKPKHLGLILTGALALFLAAVAAWSALFMDNDVADLLTGDPETELAAPQTEAVTDSEAVAEEAPLREARLPQTADVPDTEAPPLAPAAPQMSAAEVENAYRATGIWQGGPRLGPPPTGEESGSLYHTSIDPTVPVFDALALPNPKAALSDALPGSRSSPAAAGTRFALDARGLVRATPKGALTPEGVLVRAGKPPVLPPNFPARLSEPPAPSAEDTASAARLAAWRPRARPDDIVEKTERRQLGGRSREELAAFRPKLRPALPEKKIEEELSEAPTAQAVAVSKRPLARPSDIDKIVARVQRDSAIQDQTRQEKPEEQVTVASASVAKPRSVAPAVPSSASVAKQATMRNALNMRRMNLLGVSGKPSARTALVLMSNGSIKKLKVGDRLDGGKVVAIGDSELRYSKNGRSVVLKMPKG